MPTATATVTTDEGATTGAAFAGWFLVSVQGLRDGTVVLERSHDTGTTWYPVASYTDDIEENAYAPGTTTQYRLRVSSYSGGSVLLRLQN